MTAPMCARRAPLQPYPNSSWTRDKDACSSMWDWYPSCVYESRLSNDRATTVLHSSRDPLADALAEPDAKSSGSRTPKVWTLTPQDASGVLRGAIAQCHAQHCPVGRQHGGALQCGAPYYELPGVFHNQLCCGTAENDA